MPQKQAGSPSQEEYHHKMTDENRLGRQFYNKDWESLDTHEKRSCVGHFVQEVRHGEDVGVQETASEESEHHKMNDQDKQRFAQQFFHKDWESLDTHEKRSCVGHFVQEQRHRQ